MKKYLFLPALLLSSACSFDRDPITTAHDLRIELVGTDEAHCIVSTKSNRYAITAPNTILIERDRLDLKIDCDDSYSDRRRVLIIEPEIENGYWAYPPVVTVDFSRPINGGLQQGYRVRSNNDNIAEILTEQSYSYPVNVDEKIKFSRFLDTIDDAK